MKATENGIDWERLQPEDWDLVADHALSAAEGCALDPATLPRYIDLPRNPGRTRPNPRHHETYETRDGRTLCKTCAAGALNVRPYGRNRDIYQALQRARTTTTRKAAFAAHVHDMTDQGEGPA